jgi:hypothetical protein
MGDFQLWKKREQKKSIPDWAPVPHFLSRLHPQNLEGYNNEQFIRSPEKKKKGPCLTVVGGVMFWSQWICFVDNDFKHCYIYADYIQPEDKNVPQGGW